MQQIIDTFYASLRRLSAEELTRLVAPQFILNWQGTTSIPWSGEWLGVEGLLNFVKTLNAHVQVLDIALEHSLHAPECSVVVLQGHWKLVNTGTEVRALAANVFTFSNGLVASYTVLNNSAAFAQALAHGHRPGAA